ncbi:MAG: UPF0147 family protein [Candidatus Nanoarchaeia archaeon]
MHESESLQLIVGDLLMIQEDESVPKNVKQRIQNAIAILQDVEAKNLNLCIAKSVQELSDVAEDPNVPRYMQMEILKVVSQLESK